MNKISTFLEQNMRWVIGILFFITILYFDARYVSLEEYNKVKARVTVLENEFSLFKQDVRLFKTEIKNMISDVEQRQEKKIKIQNSIIDEVDVIENDVIELKAEIKWLHKFD